MNSNIQTRFYMFIFHARAKRAFGIFVSWIVDTRQKGLCRCISYFCRKGNACKWPIL